MFRLTSPSPSWRAKAVLGMIIVVGMASFMPQLGVSAEGEDLFDSLDLDANGALNATEIEHLLELYVNEPEHLAECPNVTDLLTSNDVDMSGTLERSETAGLAYQFLPCLAELTCADAASVTIAGFEADGSSASFSCSVAGGHDEHGEEEGHEEEEGEGHEDHEDHEDHDDVLTVSFGATSFECVETTAHVEAADDHDDELSSGEVWAFSMTAVAVVSIASLVAVFMCSPNVMFFEKYSGDFTAFAVGALLGGAVIHIIPEAVAEAGFDWKLSATILGGYMFTLVVEQLVHFARQRFGIDHHHGHTHGHPHGHGHSHGHSHGHGEPDLTSLRVAASHADAGTSDPTAVYASSGAGAGAGAGAGTGAGTRAASCSVGSHAEISEANCGPSTRVCEALAFGAAGAVDDPAPDGSSDGSSAHADDTAVRRLSASHAQVETDALPSGDLESGNADAPKQPADGGSAKVSPTEGAVVPTSKDAPVSSSDDTRKPKYTWSNSKRALRASARKLGKRIAATHPIVITVLISDFVHNFVDGVAIAAAFLACSASVGLTVTLAVLFHEIPAEIVDYLILRKAGMGKWRALFFNFISALGAVVGALIVLAFESMSTTTNAHFLAFSAGTLIYIGATDLLPLAMEHTTPCVTLRRILLIVFGMFILGMALFYDEHCERTLDGEVDAHNH